MTEPYSKECDCGLLIKDPNGERCTDCEEEHQIDLDGAWVRKMRLASEKAEAVFQDKAYKIMEGKDG